MQAYSQFWECLGVQRLLTSLVGICGGGKYQPRLLLDKKGPTAAIYGRIRDDASRNRLALSELLDAIYHNQIRNAFAHSDFWLLGEWISLVNHDALKTDSLTSIRFGTWDRLFSVTVQFMSALFKDWIGLERDLKRLLPFRIFLPEFPCPFEITRDERGHYSAKPF